MQPNRSSSDSDCSGQTGRYAQALATGRAGLSAGHQPAVALTALALICGLLQGCAIPTNWRAYYSPSPSGENIAFISSSDVYLVVPAEPISLGSSAHLHVRGLDGRELLAGTACDLDYPKWSRDGAWLAYHNGGKLKLWEARTGRFSTLGDEQSAEPDGFRSQGNVVWMEDGLLRCFGQSNQVWQFNPVSGQGVRLFDPGLDWSGLGAANIKLAPSGRLCAKLDRGGTTLVEVETGKEVSPLLPGYVQWSPTGRWCLLKDFRLNDPARNSRLSLYSVESRTLKELTELLPLRKVPATYRMFGATDWSADESRFISGLFWADERRTDRHVLCQVEPWAAVCLEDEFGSDLEAVSISPSGQFVAFEQRGKERGLYVAEIVSADDGKMTLGKLVRVWESLRFHAWFWSPTAPEIVVAAGDGFQKIKVAVVGKTTSAER